jgi:hypothetical protein
MASQYLASLLGKNVRRLLKRRASSPKLIGNFKSNQIFINNILR